MVLNQLTLIFLALFSSSFSNNKKFVCAPRYGSWPVENF